MRRVQAISQWFNSPPWPFCGYVILMWRLDPAGRRDYIPTTGTPHQKESH